MGLSRARAPHRHVCLCRARYGERGIPRRARPVRRQAALRHPDPRAAFVLLGDEAAARHGRGGAGHAAAAGLCAVAQELRALQVAGLSARRRAGRARLRAGSTAYCPRRCGFGCRPACRSPPCSAAASTRRWSRITRANTARRRRAISSATRNRRIPLCRRICRRRPASTCAWCPSIRRARRRSRAIDEVVDVTESFEPNLIRGAVCSLKAARRMHEDGFRVALCGEGADELFCGYPPLEVAFQADDGRRPSDPRRVPGLDASRQPATRRPLLDAPPGRDARAVSRSGGGELRARASTRRRWCARSAGCRAARPRCAISTTSIRNCRARSATAPRCRSARAPAST